LADHLLSSNKWIQCRAVILPMLVLGVNQVQCHGSKYRSRDNGCEYYCFTSVFNHRSSTSQPDHLRRGREEVYQRLSRKLNNSRRYFAQPSHNLHRGKVSTLASVFDPAFWIASV